MNAVALASTAAVISTSVAIATGINLQADEVPLWLPSEATQVAPYGQRARSTTLFIKWNQTDELPFVSAAPALDDLGWTPPPAAIPEAGGIIWATADDGIPGVVIDDDYWLRFEPVYTPIPRLIAIDEELPTAQAQTIVEEELWLPARGQNFAPQFYTNPSQDELPVSTVFEEDVRPVANVANVVQSYAQPAEDELPTPPVTILEEETVFSTAKIEPIGQYLITQPDEIFPAVVIEEGEWVAPFKPQPDGLAFSLVGTEPEIVPQPTPLNVEEDYQYTMLTSAEVFKISLPVFVEEDSPELSTPPVVEERDLGAKWPVKVTEFLTKIKDRFYWFRDEKELPKDKTDAVQKSSPAVALVEPEIAGEAKSIAEVQSDAEVAKRKRIERNNEAIMKLFI